MSKYDKLKKLNSENREKSDLLMTAATSGAKEITDDVERTIHLYKNADLELESIDAQFAKLTKFDKTDVAMLMLR